MNPVPRSELRLGELLAEGGEGRVYEVRAGSGDPGSQRVYKELRRPCPVTELNSLVGFPAQLSARDQPLSARVLSSSAWPLSVVVGDDPEVALGTVLPRAPHQFWVRHRDGSQPVGQPELPGQRPRPHCRRLRGHDARPRCA